MDSTPTTIRCQRIVFIRHGVAKHNVVDRATGKPPDPNDPTLLDSTLIPQGKHQAIQCGVKLRTWWENEYPQTPVDLVITSPLTRCLQTANLVFLEGDFYSENSKHPRVFCKENVREACGRHYTDRRRQKSVLMKHWPGVEFETGMSEEDALWHPQNRESMSMLSERIMSFMNDLCHCKENNVVIVSHGVWIETCMRMYAPEALDHGRKRVYNCSTLVADCLSNASSGAFFRLQNVRQIA